MRCGGRPSDAVACGACGCPAGVSHAEWERLGARDRREVHRFARLLGVERARREGADPSACDMLEAALYPEGIGRAEMAPKVES